jgi:hypothetical protein
VRTAQSPVWKAWPVQTPRQYVPSTLTDRVRSGISHLGLPFFLLLLPLIIWSISEVGSLPRRHARRAFSFQCVYLPFHVACTFAMVPTHSATPLLVCAAIGFILELPQIVRGFAGREPYKMPPFAILKA